MTDNTEPVARVDLTSLAESRDIVHLIESLSDNEYDLEYVPNPSDDEPEYYLVR